MFRRDSGPRSDSRLALVREKERDRTAEPATDTPTDTRSTDQSPSDAPTSDAPVTGSPTPDAPTSDPPPFEEAPTADPPPTDTAHAPDANTGRPGATSGWLGWGVFSGLLAGIAFLAINSWFAVSMGLDTAAPLRTIATIVEGPPPAEAVQGVGVVVHVVLSALFGLIFATLLLPLRRRSAGWFAWAGLLFGGIIYLVDFQVLARSVAWFSAFQTTNQPFELAAHLVFGSVLAALLLLAKPPTHARKPR